MSSRICALAARRSSSCAFSVAFYGRLGDEEEFKDAVGVVVQILVGIGVHGVGSFSTLLLSGAENLLVLEEELDFLLGRARQDVPGRLVVSLDVGFRKRNPGGRLGGLLGIGSSSLRLGDGLQGVSSILGLCTDHRQREDERQCDENSFHNFSV